MPAYEPSVVEPRLTRIGWEIDLIAAVRPASLEEFETDGVTRDAIERRLLVAIQAVLDVCSHIALRTGSREVASYADAANALARAGVLDDELADRVVAMAGMRNVLVHEYLDVDNARVFAAASELEVFERFLASIVAWMDAQG